MHNSSASLPTFFPIKAILVGWSGISLWVWFEFNDQWCWTVFHVSSICISSLKNCVFNSFADFLIRLFTFLLLSCKSSLYNLNIKPKSDIWFVNIFSHSVSYLFTLLIMSFDAISNFDEVHFFCFLCFWCQIQELITKPKPIKTYLFSSGNL